MNQTARYEFTIIVPVFNEEECMEQLGQKLAEYLPNALCKSCVLFVNDGSSDRSLEKIKALCSANPDFYYISYPRNAKKSAALKAGFDYTQSEYLGYIDADLQTLPEDFNTLLEYRDKYTLVAGIRMNRQDTKSKKLQSKIGNAFRRGITKDGAIDTGCPLKVIRTENAKRMPFFTGMHRFIQALILLQEGTAKQIHIPSYARVAGTSKYSVWNRLVGPFFDCLALAWMRRNYINYHVNDTDLEK
ncbi:MAG: glycosyltransferase [Bacteroidales bacterium]|nr:glycosyltransferase [Bacteroidales bacterium]MDE7072905.1 glycosyltransferase [Bacteroidales bacterium]